MKLSWNDRAIIIEGHVDLNMGAKQAKNACTQNILKYGLGLAGKELASKTYKFLENGEIKKSTVKTLHR